MLLENIHRTDSDNVKGTFVVRANFWPVAKDIAAMKHGGNGLLVPTPY
jgi:hypothetical protein